MKLEVSRIQITELMRRESPLHWRKTRATGKSITTINDNPDHEDDEEEICDLEEDEEEIPHNRPVSDKIFFILRNRFLVSWTPSPKLKWSVPPSAHTATSSATTLGPSAGLMATGRIRVL